MKPIVEKVLQSGLVDKHMAKMLEKWGNLPEGASEIVKDDALKDATRSQLQQLAEELGDEVDKQRTLRETNLDLDRLRWPVEVSVCREIPDKLPQKIATNIPAVIDRMGRFYFRIQDVNEEWFVPGYFLFRNVLNKTTGLSESVRELVLEKSILYVDEVPVCVQVSVDRVA